MNRLIYDLANNIVRQGIAISTEAEMKDILDPMMIGTRLTMVEVAIQDIREAMKRNDRNDV